MLAAIVKELKQGGTGVEFTADQLLIQAPVAAPGLTTRSAKQGVSANNNDDSDSSYGMYRNKTWHSADSLALRSPGLSEDSSERRQPSGLRNRVIVDEESECGPGSDGERADEHHGAVLNPICFEERGSDMECTEQTTSMAAAEGEVSKTQARRSKSVKRKRP